MTGRAETGAAIRDALARAAAHRPLVAALAVALPALVLYTQTLLPDVGFWDTAEFQAIGPVLGIAHPTGYPAYTLLAWLASVVFQPFGNEAFRANLLSAVLTATAVGLVAATVTHLTRRLVVGVAAGVALAVSVEGWRIALRADPHALHLLLAALLLALLVACHDRVRAGLPADRWLIAAAVVYGVSLANHGLTILLAPGIALFVLAAYPRILARPRLIVVCAAGLVVTAVLLYAYLPIRSAMDPPLDYANPETWEGFRYLVFAEQFRGTFQEMPDAAPAIALIAGETLDQLGIFAVLAVIGVLAAASRSPALLLLLVGWFGVNWYFALGYVNADIGRYYLVPLLAAAVLGGLGAGALADGAERALTRVAPRDANAAARRRTASIALAAALALILIAPSLVAAAGRYGSVDASRDRLARTWLERVAAALPPDAVIVSWWSYSTTLWYGRYVEGVRPDVTIVDDSTIVQEDLGSPEAVIDSYLGRRPVFLIRLPRDLPPFEQRYQLTRLPGMFGGDVYRVDGLRPTASRGTPYL